ncbi:GNAT family N-acetyltransferase [Mangrovihabitans endophyticus]|uniref:N-acetyltransferase domain-containing protein n=1 Tax=Mangrovihabitans endophyticus TaxID=1751298 RepID=A0A8J3BZQ9_9ACTN|nr:GNAT family N-acetyltransferase [Mangrovihabitans endophyticus]GGK97965.1 hypothetical protein GCM10012284_35270 [Mangrovihabitans endophyticus]
MLRAAAEADRDVVLAWRNHPEVRSVSFTTHVITPDEHAGWWQRALDDPQRHVLIFEDGGVPAGVVTIDLRDSVPTWGFYLDVAGLSERGVLLPAWMRLEKETVDFAFGQLGLDRLGGETLASNRQVIALHRRFGFRETRRYEREVDGALQTVVWTERGRP